LLVCSDAKHEALAVFLPVNDGACHLGHQLELGPRLVEIPVFDDSLERITHDGDQHVEHSHRAEECCQHEEREAHASLFAILKAVNVELSQSQQVLIEHDIWQPVREWVINDLFVYVTIQIKHVHRDAKHHQIQ